MIFVRNTPGKRLPHNERAVRAEQRLFEALERRVETTFFYGNYVGRPHPVVQAPLLRGDLARALLI